MIRIIHVMLTKVSRRYDSNHSDSFGAFESLHHKIVIMTYILSRPETSNQQTLVQAKKSLLSRFFQWAANEDEAHHIAWVGGSVTIMTAIIFPLTMAAILMNGAVFGLIIAAMVSLVLVVTTNLAAMETRYTIPFFFLGILIDLCVIIASFMIK